MIQNNFFIVRHGESENNLLDIESSKIENKDQFGLSENGKKMTQIEAKKFNNFDLIISSPFRRTKETAIIFAKNCNCEIIENDLIREVCVGDFELQKYEKAESFSEKYGDNIPFPGGESLVNAKKRTIQFFEQINQIHKNKNILIVTHGSIVQILLFYIEKDFNWEKYLKEYNNARKVFEISR